METKSLRRWYRIVKSKRQLLVRMKKQKSTQIESLSDLRLDNEYKQVLEPTAEAAILICLEP